MNKIQLPFWGFTKHTTFDIWYSEQKGSDGLVHYIKVWVYLCMYYNTSQFYFKISVICYEIQIMENIHINSWHICATSNSPGCQANNVPLSCFWLANLRTKSKQTNDGRPQMIDCKYTYQWCSSSSITFIFSFFSSSTNVSRMKLKTRPFKWRWSINQSFVTFSSIRKYWNINFLLDKGQSFRSWFSTITWEQKSVNKQLIDEKLNWWYWLKHYTCYPTPSSSPIWEDMIKHIFT